MVTLEGMGVKGIVSTLGIVALATFPSLLRAQTPPAIAAAIASPLRPDAGKALDPARKPADLVTFAGVKAGDRIADFIPGSGYFTRIFSIVAGPTGKVYAFTPGDLMKRAPRAADDARALAAQPAFGNVVDIEPALAETAFPEPLDLFWISQNYHDLSGIWGKDAVPGFNAAVFKALKPGGVYFVTDHVATPGAGETVTGTLHRIDPETVKAQVTAAGFVFEGASSALANPADPHDKAVFDPSIRGRTDQFILKFRKPAR